MNIVQAHKYYWYRDGASNYALDLSHALEDAGNRVIPFSMKEKKSLDSPYEKYFVSSMNLRDPDQAKGVNKLRYGLSMIHNAEARENMAWLLENEKVDIVHLHNIYHHISPSIFKPIKKKKIPVVMTLHDYKLLSPNYSMFHHGDVHEEDAKGFYLSCIKNKCMKDSRAQSALVTLEMIWHHKIMRYYERYVDLFIAPSEFMMNKCIEFGWKKEKFVHLPNPIDTTKFTFTPKDKGYVAYIGRLSEEKGLRELLSAAQITRDIEYKIIGDGPLMDELDERIRKANMEHVTLEGFQTGEKLRELIAGARIIVVPSIWYENYPLSVLEAKSMGKIVVGSNIGGIPEQLSPEFLADSGDILGLAKTIDMWYNAPLRKRQSIAKKQRKEVEKVNSMKTHVEEVLEVYKQFT